MNNRTLFIAFLCLVSPWVSADQVVAVTENTVKSQDAENSIRISTRPEILGLWGMSISNNKKCTEYYNFRSSNEVVVNSDKEWSTGLFEYQPSQDMTSNTLPTLLIQVNYENNEKDCSGNQVDQAGELSQYFVKWNTPNLIDFCSTEKGGQCFATLRRVLP